MKYSTLLTIFLFIGLSDLLAQHLTDTIQIINIPGTGYTLNGNYLNSKRMKAVLLTNNEASKVYRNALANRGTAVTFLITGGVILAGGLIYDPSVGLFKVAGGFFILLALPAWTVYDMRTDKAVEIYNNEIRQKYYPEKTVSIGLNSSGLGIRLNF